MRPRTRWVGRARFAEEAEAVGIPTTHIVASGSGPDGRQAVLYTERIDYEGEDWRDVPILAARVRRNRDGILETVGDPFEVGRAGDILDALGIEPR